MSRVGGMRTAAPLLLTLAMFMVLVGLAVVADADPRFDLGISTAVFFLGIAAWAVLQASVGSVIAWRRPENRVGRLMQASGPLLIGIFLGYLIGAWRYATVGPSDVLGGVAAWWGSLSILPALFVAFPMLGLLFPDGRLPSRRFVWPLRAIVAGLVVPTLLFAIGRGPIDAELPDNPFGLVAIPAAVRETASLVATVALIAGLGLAVAAVVGRWRRGDRRERAQLKWLLAAFSVAPILFAVSWAGPDGDPADLIDALSAVSVILVPLAVGIAVLRYRLYDIDRIISRTLAYGALSVLLFAIFFAANVLLQPLISPLVGGNVVATAAATLLVASLFQPLRRRSQAVMDRRFHRAGYDADRTVAAFAGRVREGVDLLRLVLDLERTTAAAMEPTTTSVWLRRARDPR